MLNIKLMVILMAVLFTKGIHNFSDYNSVAAYYIIIPFVVIIESSQCEDDEVQVVPMNQTLIFGRVEICIDSNWGPVCSDGWDNDDAAVVCYQLGYGRDGKIASIATS